MKRKNEEELNERERETYLSQLISVWPTAVAAEAVGAPMDFVSDQTSGTKQTNL